MNDNFLIEPNLAAQIAGRTMHLTNSPAWAAMVRMVTNAPVARQERFTVLRAAWLVRKRLRRQERDERRRAAMADGIALNRR